MVVMTRVTSWMVECLGSVWLMTVWHSGQVWVYLLKPGKQGTRQLKMHGPRKQEMKRKAQPEEEISLEMIALTFWRQVGQQTYWASVENMTGGLSSVDDFVWLLQSSPGTGTLLSAVCFSSGIITRSSNTGCITVLLKMKTEDWIFVLTHSSASGTTNYLRPGGRQVVLFQKTVPVFQ